MLTKRDFLLYAGAIALVPKALPQDVAAPTQESEAFKVHMYNVHPDDPSRRMVFSPRVLRVPLGATVEFIPENPGHNCQSTQGMIPEGAEAWRGPFSKTHKVTFTVPGYYGYNCLPHRSMGMVGLVIVGNEEDGANLEAARAVKHPGRAGDVWNDIWASV